MLNTASSIKYTPTFSSNPMSKEKAESPDVSSKDEAKSNASAYMIGATALASVIALGILGRKGKLGAKIQKVLGGKPVQEKAEQVAAASANLASPSKNAKKALADLYSKVIAKAQKNGNTKRAKIFEQCKNNIDSLDTQTTYANLLDAIYKDLRLGEYPTSSIITKNIEEITAKGTQTIRVKNENGWHYRIPLGRKSAKSVDRVSVNALADENLVKALDDLFASQKVKGYYKTPDTTLNWLERHDPITIYLDEKATPETLDLIKSTCGKYIRSTEDVLSGKKFASGLALQKSPDEQDIRAILAEAKNVDAELESVLEKQFTNANGKLITSAGYIDSAKKLIELVRSC